jgi:hypothetical protein
VEILVPSFAREDGLPCNPENAELFHEKQYEAQAKKMCKKCPFMTECQTFAFQHPELSGVWGGLSQRERRRQVKNRYTKFLELQERMKALSLGDGKLPNAS